MSDLFHEALPSRAIDDVFLTMARCPQHTFLVLTKRAERMATWIKAWAALPNIWLGVSVEDQATADARAPWLLKVAARGWNTFIRYEPALGPVDWAEWIEDPLFDVG